MKMKNFNDTCNNEFNQVRKNCDAVFGDFKSTLTDVLVGETGDDRKVNPTIKNIAKAKLCEKLGIACSGFEDKKRGKRRRLGQYGQ